MVDLPFALVCQLGLLALPVLVIVCFFLLGILEICHLIALPCVGDRVGNIIVTDQTQANREEVIINSLYRSTKQRLRI